MSKVDMRRAIVFAHFDRDNIVDDYVVYYMRSLREVCNYLVFVTTSTLPENEISKVNGICDKIVSRENVGYDFMSYKAGLQHVQDGDYSEVVCCNDSVYGPLFPLSAMFREMQKEDCEFWGITKSYEKGYHIQSYFLVFREAVLKSRCFKEFWDRVTVRNAKQEIIDDYEVGLSQFLIGNGFKARAYSIYRPSSLELVEIKLRRLTLRKLVSSIPLIKQRKEQVVAMFDSGQRGKLNPTHFFWRQLIKKEHMPFVKVELLRDNPMNMGIADYDTFIKSLSDYDTGYIKKHLERMRRETRRASMSAENISR
jgi:rhamnosyltransferase